MKILALYDVHGNADALDAVLADPRAVGAEVVVVGGDTVPGAFAREALERLEALEARVEWVRGNGEREVAEAVGAPVPDPDDLVRETARRTMTALGERRARALGELPLTVEVDGVLFCHATPRDDEELVTRISNAARWAEVLGGVEHALVVAGHTHQQDDRVVGGVRFVNAGSVGLPYEGDGAARWLWIENGAPTLNTTNYDAATAGRRILRSGWPDERSTAAALIDPVEAIVVTELFEARVSGA